MNIPQDHEMKMEEDVQEDKLNLIVSNRAEYFDLLFDLLNLGIPDVTSAVWSLLMQIPVNHNLFESISSLRAIKSFGQEHTGWKEIIDPNQTYKMLYSLQILNTLVTVNNQNQSEQQVQEKREWRQRFLELGGFNHLYMILITSDVNEMLDLTSVRQQNGLTSK